MHYPVDKYPPYLSKKGVATTNILCGEATEIEVSSEVSWLGTSLDVATDAREYELDTDSESSEKATTGIFYTVGHLVDGKVNVI